MQDQGTNRNIINNPELNELLNPPKSKTLLVVSLAGFGLMLLIGISSLCFLFYSVSTEFENGDDYFNDDYSGYEDSDDGIGTKISPNQAKAWLLEKEENMNNLASLVEQQKNMHSLWVATSQEQDDTDILVWINEKPCTADPGAVSAEAGDERYLFSDVLKDLQVGIIDFYEIINLMEKTSMEGYELYRSSEKKVEGIEFFHESYAGLFYYASDGESPDTEVFELAEKWWFIE